LTRDALARKGKEVTTAAGEWADSTREAVRGRVLEAGYRTDNYVRRHPFRCLAGICCLGLACGWLLGRGSKGSRR